MKTTAQKRAPRSSNSKFYKEDSDAESANEVEDKETQPIEYNKASKRKPKKATSTPINVDEKQVKLYNIIRLANERLEAVFKIDIYV